MDNSVGTASDRKARHNTDTQVRLLGVARLFFVCLFFSQRLHMKRCLLVSPVANSTLITCSDRETRLDSQHLIIFQREDV